MQMAFSMEQVALAVKGSTANHGASVNEQIIAQLFVNVVSL